MQEDCCFVMLPFSQVYMRRSSRLQTAALMQMTDGASDVCGVTGKYPSFIYSTAYPSIKNY